MENILKLPRLIIVTGKGGVGKTTSALALTKYLQDQGHQAVYLTLQMGTLRREGHAFDHQIIKNLCDKLKIEHDNLVLKTCLTEYVAQKLGSSLVADWVVNTKFFMSLVEIIPGFSQLIYMGRILQELKLNPSLHYVLDAAATGHALTLVESIYNFQKIFSIGPLNQDMQMLKKLFTSENFVKLLLITIPQELSLNEFIELKDNLQEIDSSISCSMNLNQCFSISDFPWDTIEKTLYWKNKLEMEKVLANRIGDEFIRMPMIANIDLAELILKLSKEVNWTRSLS
jgi:anion-transporting  ArsA/GET3 family ATPase